MDPRKLPKSQRPPRPPPPPNPRKVSGTSCDPQPPLTTSLRQRPPRPPLPPNPSKVSGSSCDPPPPLTTSLRLLLSKMQQLAGQLEKTKKGGDPPVGKQVESRPPTSSGESIKLVEMEIPSDECPEEGNTKAAKYISTPKSVSLPEGAPPNLMCGNTSSLEKTFVKGKLCSFDPTVPPPNLPTGFVRSHAPAPTGNGVPLKSAVQPHLAPPPAFQNSQWHLQRDSHISPPTPYRNLPAPQAFTNAVQSDHSITSNSHSGEGNRTAIVQNAESNVNPISNNSVKSTVEDKLSWDQAKRKRRERKAIIESEAKKRARLDESMNVVRTEAPSWTRSSPAELYFTRDIQLNSQVGTTKMQLLVQDTKEHLVNRVKKARDSQPPEERKRWIPKICHHHDSDSDTCSSDSEGSDVEDMVEAELNRKRNFPYKIHPELWFNEVGEVNDGPACRCSLKSRDSGIRHEIYPGEEEIPLCDPHSNNLDRLHHYIMTIGPNTNFTSKHPTIIYHDSHQYVFEGFSLFFHEKLPDLPPLKTLRFSFKYTITLQEVDPPSNFTIEALDTFSQWLLFDVIELYDFDLRGRGITGGCPRIHLMPRFTRPLPENGVEVLSMNEVLRHVIRHDVPLMNPTDLPRLSKLDDIEWLEYVDEIRGELVMQPDKRPSSIRIDQVDRNNCKMEEGEYPMIIHFGTRPMQLSWIRDSNYRRLLKQVLKLKHLMSFKTRMTPEDRQLLHEKDEELQNIRMDDSMKKEVPCVISCENFRRTGLKADVCQHALILPVILVHIRFHICLCKLEETLDYKFKDRYLLQLALTHPSYRNFFGMNADHIRNSLSNCGLRISEYGSDTQNAVVKRKRGINVLMSIMSQMGKQEETLSEIEHNERLEYLGDAVVEFITSVHLYYMFPNLQEGSLATYRSALVQNLNLQRLAQRLGLQHFLLYWHGPDICHESDLKHALANAFEALLGALFLDGGLPVADRMFASVAFPEPELRTVWCLRRRHELQDDEPDGDRHWIEDAPVLKKIQDFEESTGIVFKHIRLLARAFTPRNTVAYNNLTMGHNQRLEFLGDSVLQLIVTDYLYRYFPDHHEGHLTLLRSSLVNNRTQAVISDELGLQQYTIKSSSGDNYDAYNIPSCETKQKADLFESLLGAMYVDRNLYSCQALCQSIIFPRLRYFILGRHWNDPKSQLQQMCLTLRSLDGGDPDLPVYKVIGASGPSNYRIYTVAVYFRGQRLATGLGHSKQDGQMDAAANALKNHESLFPHLRRQRRFMKRVHGMEIPSESHFDDFGSGESSPSGSNRSPSKSRKSNRMEHPKQSRNIGKTPSEEQRTPISSAQRQSSGRHHSGDSPLRHHSRSNSSTPRSRSHQSSVGRSSSRNFKSNEPRSHDHSSSFRGRGRGFQRQNPRQSYMENSRLQHPSRDYPRSIRPPYDGGSLQSQNSRYSSNPRAYFDHYNVVGNSNPGAPFQNNSLGQFRGFH